MGMTPRAFVADDDPATRQVLTRVLSLLGFDATAFDDGIALVEAVRFERPALIVVDQHMTHWNGTDAVRHIRTLGADCPVVFVTAFPDPTLHRVVARLGRCAILSKPVDLGVLRDCIARLLAEEREVRATARAR